MKVIELLRKARELYTGLANKSKYAGMCWCFKAVLPLHSEDRTPVPYYELERQIPEFNPYYLESTNLEKFEKNKSLRVGLEFWWDILDTESRIKAFDKLIKVYEKSDKEFIW